MQIDRTELIHRLGRNPALFKALDRFAREWKEDLERAAGQNRAEWHTWERDQKARVRHQFAGVERIVKRLRRELSKFSPSTLQYFALDSLDESLSEMQHSLRYFFKPGKRGPHPTAPIGQCAQVALILKNHGIRVTMGSDGDFASTLRIIYDHVGLNPPVDMGHLVRKAVHLARTLEGVDRYLPKGRG